MYVVHYYLGGKFKTYNYKFTTIWGATFKARSIYEEYGIATDVMNDATGEVLVSFKLGEEPYVAQDLETDIQVLALHDAV